MLNRIFLVACATLTVSGAPPCEVPERAVADLTALFTYYNGRGPNRPKEERFSVLLFGNRLFLRHKTPSPRTDPNLYPVYVYDGEGLNHPLNCPSDATWVGCVIDWVENPPSAGGERMVHGEEEPRRYGTGTGKEHPCEFTLQVPAWAPSPDDERKRKIAAEILSEIQNRVDMKPRAVYVRDFNLNDPDITIYIDNRGRDDRLLGCYFRLTESPHCGWHMFGQAPRDALRRDIMRRPYRLYPPPTGKP